MRGIRILMLGAVLAGVSCANGSKSQDDDEEAIDAARGEGKGDGVFVGDDSPEQFGALRVANELAERELVADAHVGRRAAAGLVRFRAGRDGLEGTADDWRFESLEELDAVAYVGDTTIGKLATYAAARGWIPARPVLVSTVPAAGAEGVDRCGALEMRFSQPLDPESIEVEGDARQVVVEGDRVLATGFNLPGPASLQVRRARAAGGGPPMRSWATLSVRLGEAASPALVRTWPVGTGAPRDGSVGVDVCGIADRSLVTLRLLDGGQEVALGPLAGNSAQVWRTPLSPLSGDHEYDVVASVAGGPERRWRFRTAAEGFRREAVSVTSRTLLDAADDGTVAAYEPGGWVTVGRLGGTWTQASPGSHATVRAFARPGGGVRSVWETDNLVKAGSWTSAAGWSSTDVAIGAGLDGFRNGWVAVQRQSDFTIAIPAGASWRMEVVRSSPTLFAEDVQLETTADGVVWLAWRDRDRDEVFLSRRTGNGWMHHSLRNDTHEYPTVALDGAGAVHVITDTPIDGIVTWGIDGSSKDGPPRRLGGGNDASANDARFVADGRGNLLALWSSDLGGFARWFRNDLSAWGAREDLGAPITDAAAAPDGTIYVLAGGGLWRGGLGRPWERIADAPDSHVAVLAGAVVVYGDRGLYSLGVSP